MTGIRTAMVTAPALIGDMISRLATGRINLTFVGHLTGRRALGRRLNRLSPDLIIIGLCKSDSDTLIRSLLLELPNSKLIAIQPDGRRIVGYRLCISQIRLSDLSPSEVVNFIERDGARTNG